MPDATAERSIEVVRGRLGGERGEQVLRFWAQHGALSEAEGRRRLGEVVCLLIDGEGAVAGVNSVYPANVALISGRLFWIYRSLLPGCPEDEPRMLAAAFEALEEEFDPAGDGPIGVCVLLAGEEEIGRRPEAEWRDPQMLYAGYLQDGRQVRIGYFWRARIGEGARLPVLAANTPLLERESAQTWRMESGHRIVLVREQEAVTDEQIIDLWTREGVLTIDEAQRRVKEVIAVALSPQGEPVGVGTTYLDYNEQLRMQLWYYRTFVARAHRDLDLSVAIMLITRDHMIDRFTSGEDTRGAGMIFEIEYAGWKHSFNGALILPSGFIFISENERGDHVRVRYFPGAMAPDPAVAARLA